MDCQRLFCKLTTAYWQLFTESGPGRTRTYEARRAADLQSAPFATRDTDPGKMFICYSASIALAAAPEPTMGLEPITYALQEHCSAN